jgi:hypothetical protein
MNFINALTNVAIRAAVRPRAIPRLDAQFGQVTVRTRGYLLKNDENERLIELVRNRLGN